MIRNEKCDPPADRHFDIAVVAVGYESRCRWVVETFEITARNQLGLEFGFLNEFAYESNRDFFARRGWVLRSMVDDPALKSVTEAICSCASDKAPVRVFVDVSSMSREMMASVALAIDAALSRFLVDLTICYAPSSYSGTYSAAPIRLAAPIKPELAGWSSRPDKPLGVLVGLGCEPGLALGALQVLEPYKAWIYSPIGLDERFERALAKANAHVEDIFNVTKFHYELLDPVIARGRVEALLNSIDVTFRVVAVPFGPKVFAWLVLSTVIFGPRRAVGVWAFSSKEQAEAVDRTADGTAVWYSALLSR